MGIDVIDALHVDTGIPDGVGHGGSGAAAVFRRQGHVVGVPAHAEADYFRVDIGPAGPGGLVFLQHQNPRPVTEYKAVPVPVPGPRGGCRVIVAGGERPGGGKSAQAHRRGGHFRTADQHGIGIALGNEFSAQPDVVGPRGAGGNDGQVGALQVIHHRQVAGDHVDDGTGYEKRGDPARTGGADDCRVFLYLPYPADAGTDGAAHPGGHLLGDFQAAVAHGLDAGGHAELHKQVHFARVLLRQVKGDIEIFDAGTETGAESGDIKAFDGGHPALARQDILPGRIHGIAQGTQHPHACHYHSSANQGTSSYSTSASHPEIRKAVLW